MSNSCELNSKPKNFTEFITSKRFYKPLIGIILGATAGYLYYYFVGCSSGTCGITSNPYSSVLMGSALGLFATNNSCGC